MRKKVIVALASIAVTGALGLGAAAPVSADPMGFCPHSDQFPLPKQMVPSGDAKDKNNNGLVCEKFGPNGFTGGPDDDDVTDDIIAP